jgi:dienelactone hydrolase
MTVLLTMLCAFAAHAEQVSFPSLDGTPLQAQVFQPSHQPPRGAVVALHGCDGVNASAGPRKGRLGARHQAMADMLAAEGYAVVFPDSLTPRGEGEICTQRAGSRRIGQGQRRADALAALAWVAAQPWAPPRRIALLGWSNGGGTVLAATDGTRRDVRAQTVRPAIAIAFYPSCGAALKAGYQPHTRLVMLLGARDDWTPPGPCIELGQRTGADVTVYADSYHGFDNPSGEVRLRTDVPNGVNPGQGVHVGANPVAREQANARVRELLREAFR